MASLKLRISGMHCGNCKTKVERALKNVPGSYAVMVDLEGGNAEVDYDGKVPPEKFVEAIQSAGYSAQVSA
jgi:copper chaperone CopZ